MVYTNVLNDFTLTPISSTGSLPAYQSAIRNRTDQTFEQAAQTNRIYQNNGLICQRQMCESMTGCSSAVSSTCTSHPDWNKVVDFCGPIGTRSQSMYGAYWTLQPADARQQTLTATQQQVGMTSLPTPWNVVGMY